MKKITFSLFIIFALAFALQQGIARRALAQCEPWNYNCQPPPGGCPGQVWAGWPSCECIESPIIIDLAGNGYQLTDAAHGVVFDLRGDGKPHMWSWTAQGSNNAFLALDRNGNGTIDDGKELFGNNTEQPVTEDPNGFTALAVFDTNGDHWIDANDPIYPKLLLWVDANHDGISQPSELFSLAQKGVEAISCDYKLSKRSDRYGNRFRYKAQARINGVERWVWDVFLLPGK